jgi:hypothetical protein
MRQYKLLDVLLEFKFIKQSETGLDRTDLRQRDRVDLTKLDVVQKKLTEAIIQFQQYRATLTQKYEASLRLRTYAVVALGFDRLVWQEV